MSVRIFQLKYEPTKGVIINRGVQFKNHQKNFDFGKITISEEMNTLYAIQSATKYKVKEYGYEGKKEILLDFGPEGDDKESLLVIIPEDLGIITRYYGTRKVAGRFHDFGGIYELTENQCIAIDVYSGKKVFSVKFIARLYGDELRLYNYNCN